MFIDSSRIAAAGLLALGIGALAPAAWAGVHVSIGLDPFGIVTAPAPPVVYAPPPAYLPPAYAPAPVYEPPPVVYLGGGHWGDWGRRRDWHHDHHHH